MVRALVKLDLWQGEDNFGPDPTRSYKKTLYIIKGNLHKVWSIII